MLIDWELEMREVFDLIWRKIVLTSQNDILGIRGETVTKLVSNMRMVKYEMLCSNSIKQSCWLR